jgi:hypothetical protein
MVYTKLKSRLIGLSVILLFMGTAISVVASPPFQSSSEDEEQLITINFVDAYYTDLSGNGLEDDVYGSLEFHFGGKNRITFEYYITLYLPSGHSFTYGYMISTKFSYLFIENFFYAHAFETGDYTFRVDIITKTGGVTHDVYWLVFDPPGHGPGDTTFELAYDGY